MPKVLEKSNENGLVLLTDLGAWEKLYHGEDLSKFIFEDSEEIKKFNELCFKHDKSSWILEIYDKNKTYDINTTDTFEWFTPEPWKSMDIVEWLILQCKTEKELERVEQEIILFQDRNMIQLLRHVKFLVDFFRENSIIWGVGRGSSVASYCLYLIGIHRINSLELELPIEEFLK